MKTMKAVISFSMLFALLAGCGASDSQILDEISGVWQGGADGSMIIIDLGASQPTISVNGNEFDASVESVDSDNLIVSTKVDWEGTPVVWSLRQIYSDDGTFTLLMTLHNGVSDNLAFVRNL